MSTGYAGFSSDAGIITIPDDNDLADAESVNRAFRALRDSLVFATDAEAQRPIHPLVALDSTDSTTIRVRQVAPFVLYRSPTAPNTYVRVEKAAETVTSAALDAAPGAWAADKVYYLYLRYDSATDSVKYMVSLTAPDKALVFIGTPTRTVRYCGCFTTDGAATIRPIQKIGREYRYLSQVAPPAFGSSVTVFTSLDLSKLKPPHARRVHMRVWGSTGNAIVDVVSLRRNGGPGVCEVWAQPGAAVGEKDLDVPTDDAGLIEYKVSDAAASVDMRVLGFTEGEII